MAMPTEIVDGSTRYLPDPYHVRRAAALGEAVDLMTQNIGRHRLRLSNPRERSVTCMTSALDLGECALTYVQYGFDAQIDLDCLAEYFLVKANVVGEARFTLGSRSLATLPGSILVVSAMERVRVGMPAQGCYLTARVSRSALETRITERLGYRPPRALQFDLEVPGDSDFWCAWQQLLAHICQVSANAPGALASAAVREQYARTMMELLVHSARHNYSEALLKGSERSTPWHVRRAREYVSTHLPETHSVAEVAAHVGISVRALQNGFRQALGLTPAEYIRQERVQVLRADPQLSVASVMQALGIVSFGRYAHYYRQQFGVWPSATLKRSR